MTTEERNTYAYNKLMSVGIATVYGSCFGKHFIDNVRFSFSATNLAVIEEAKTRIQGLFG
ncbi:MAG: hypothetical protein K8H86_11370 [Ignavibacteriaceae bacterium]|nr:hypothetical protein [Ignavibacteriaceae bacterium]